MQRLLPVLLTALALLVAACGSSSDDGGGTSTGASSGSGASTELKPVRIALDFTANVNYLGIYAAIERGDFTKQGIKPVIVPYAGTPAETLVKANRTDLGISFPSEVITQRAAGLKYKAVAALVSRNTTALAVDAKSDITRPAQLSGKKYGGFGIASDEPIIKEIIRRDGVADPSFEQVTLNTDAYVALAKGRIDYSAVFAGIDDVTAAAQGTKLRLFPYAKYLGAAGDFPNAVFVASDEAISGKADLLKRTLAALSAGYTWAAANPAAAAKTLVSANRTALGKSASLVDQEAARVAPSFVEDGRWGALTDTDFSGLETILADGGVVKGTPPPTSELFDTSLLPQG